MGTDLWTFYEKRNQQKVWECVAGDFVEGWGGKNKGHPLATTRDSVLSVQRSYGLFSALAGVRLREGDPEVAVRGLPDDASLMVRLESEEWSGDAHHHHWYSLQELLDFDWESHRRCEFFRDNVIPALQNFGAPDEVRMIFWFDN